MIRSSTDSLKAATRTAPRRERAVWFAVAIGGPTPSAAAPHFADTEIKSPAATISGSDCRDRRRNGEHPSFPDESGQQQIRGPSCSVTRGLPPPLRRAATDTLDSVSWIPDGLLQLDLYPVGSTAWITMP